MMPVSFMDILICPSCRSASVVGNQCKACSATFREQDGTICLLSERLEARIEYQSTYITLEDVQAALEHAFVAPEVAGAHPDVYHLDRAHAQSIEALAPGSIVLEIGCGGGQMRPWVEGLGLRYVGTDIAKDRVHDELRRFSGPDFLSDIHNIPIESNSVDLVYSAAVFEHLSSPHLAAQEVFRILKPGGFFLGNCSFMEAWHDESFFHMSPNGAAAILLQAGFQPKRIWPSKNYSGYISLFRMGNKFMKVSAPIGRVAHFLNGFGINIKRKLRGNGYSDRAYLKDIAITAGATDWIAEKLRH